jgi:ATP-dependent Clp protease, protease subunit
MKFKGKVKPYFRAAVRDGGVLEISIYEEIGEDFWTGGGVTASSVKQQLDQAGAYNSILLRINSPGGDAFEGTAIGNVLRSQGKPVKGVIDGIAASAASVLAMACDELTMGVGSMMMIHQAWTICMGNTDDMRKMSDTLSRIDNALADGYVKKTGKAKDEILQMMKSETWMSAQECVDGGFADALSTEGDDRKDAKALGKQFKSLVDQKLAVARAKATAEAPAPIRNDEEEVADDDSGMCDCDCQACMGNDCANCSMTDCDDQNCMDCPAQQETDSDGDMDDSATTTPAAEAAPDAAASTSEALVNLAAALEIGNVQAVTDYVNEPVPAPAAEEPSNLSLYEARLSLLSKRAV